MEKYKKKLTEYEDTLSNKYASFDYDAEADELFRLQRAQIERNPKDGVSDILAQYAANTGMGGSSAAMTAAQRTASKYNGMIADALAKREQEEYSRWESEKAALEQKIASTKQDAYNEAQMRASLGDYSGYQGLGYDTSAYESKLATAEEREAYDRALADASAKAAYGDFSGLKALGFDTSAYEKRIADEQAATKRAADLTEAQIRASLGDYSGYQALGFDTSAYESKLTTAEEREAYDRALADASAKAAYGDLSGLKALGFDTSAYEKKLAADAIGDEVEVGKNGMTRAEYDAQMDYLMQIFRSADDEQKAEIYARMEKIHGAYFGYATEGEVDSAPTLTHAEASETLYHVLYDDTGSMREGNIPVDRETYLALLRYFQYYPYVADDREYVGEDALSYFGIIPVSSTTTITTTKPTTTKKN